MTASALHKSRQAPELVEAEVAEQSSSQPSSHLLFRSTGFWLVLAFKLLLGSFVASHYLRDLFVPFTNYFVDSRFANPWSWFAAHGVLNSFPYPPVMLYIMAAPRLLLAPF